MLVWNKFVQNNKNYWSTWRARGVESYRYQDRKSEP